MSESNHKTPFVKGNKFWLNRSSHGRSPIFATPEDLWNAAVEYFTWVDENPLWEDKLVIYQGVATHEPVAKMRAMTVHGLCLYLDITNQALLDYAKRPDYIEVTTRIQQVIRDQKFVGAAADLLNANIIARDLGLADKQDVDHKSSDRSMTPVVATVDSAIVSALIDKLTD